MRWILTLLSPWAVVLLPGCSESRPVVVSVGDPASAVWDALKRQGHQIAKIPFNGQIQELIPTPKDGSESKVIGMMEPYDVDGRVVLFTHEYSSNTISAISVGKESVPTLEVPKSTRRE